MRVTFSIFSLFCFVYRYVFFFLLLLLLPLCAPAFIHFCLFLVAFHLKNTTRNKLPSDGKTCDAAPTQLSSTRLGLDWLVYNLYYINFSLKCWGGEGLREVKKKPDTSFEWESIGLSTSCIAAALATWFVSIPACNASASACSCGQTSIFYELNSSKSGNGSGSLLLTVLPTAI